MASLVSTDASKLPTCLWLMGSDDGRNRVAANVPVIGCSPSAKPNIESRRPCVRQQEDEEEDHDDDEHGGERQGWGQITPAPCSNPLGHPPSHLLILQPSLHRSPSGRPGGSCPAASCGSNLVILYCRSTVGILPNMQTVPTCYETNTSRTSSSASSYQSHCSFDCSTIWNQNARITPLERNLF